MRREFKAGGFSHKAWTAVLVGAPPQGVPLALHGVPKAPRAAAAVCQAPAAGLSLYCRLPALA